MLARSMSGNIRIAMTDLRADPFTERPQGLLRIRMPLLGAHFEFESNSPELLHLVEWAYADLPPLRLARHVPRLKIRLLLAPAASRARRTRPEPAPMSLFAGAGTFGGATASSGIMIASPGEATALIVVPREMLRFPYHIRYEYIEFAVFTLAARCQTLVPLHAACVGAARRGVLLLGTSGAGKSTLTLCCALAGMEVLAEDSVFLAPRSLLAVGVPNFLHVRAETLHWLEAAQRAAIRQAPIIRRRSGVKKYEVNLRNGPYCVAPSPLRIVAALFLSPKRADGPNLLSPLSKTRMLRALAADQPFAANQGGWPLFSRRWNTLKVYELRRGRHPKDGVDAVKRLLGAL
jgi:hypothetical protein